MLFDIALNNNQVQYILSDEDVSEFFNKLIEEYGIITEKTKKIKSLLCDCHH